MANINKKSIRSELDQLKSNFKQLHQHKKISSEALVLIKSLFMLLDVLVAIFLEKKTNKNAANSSKPPSQTEKDDSALTQKGSKGKGKRETNTTAENTRTIETVTVLRVDHCDVCGEPLKSVPCRCHERRTKIDIVFEKTVTHVDAEIKRCPACQATVKAQHPKDMPGPLQYGNGLKAYVIQLLIAQIVPLNRVQKMIKTLIGKTIAESTLLGYVMQLYLALADWEQSAIGDLLKTLSLHTDETSMRVNKKNHWVHVYASGDITLKFLHPKRGKKANEGIDIIPRYGGIVIHDCWASYLSYEHCHHGLCGSHLLRELTFIIESNGYRWAKNMKRLLKKTCKKVSKRKAKKLFSKEYERLQKNYRSILTRGEKELPAIPEKSSGRRGKIAKSDAHNLLERLQKHEPSVLLFAKNSYVPFTNNRAERDLRMGKVKQKVSGCFRSEKYAKAYCRISSYLQTMANKGINPLIAVQMVLNGEVK